MLLPSKVWQWRMTFIPSWSRNCLTVNWWKRPMSKKFWEKKTPVNLHTKVTQKLAYQSRCRNMGALCMRAESRFFQTPNTTLWSLAKYELLANKLRVDCLSRSVMSAPYIRYIQLRWATLTRFEGRNQVWLETQNTSQSPCINSKALASGSKPNTWDGWHNTGVTQYLQG